MINRYEKSQVLWKRANQVLVPGGSTISKLPYLYPYGYYPIYLESGQGAKVFDVDGNQYIDFQSANGAIILGLRHREIEAAMEKQREKGNLFSLLSPLPIELAEKLCFHIPSAERIRILKTGSDAVSGAVRIARAYVNKPKILTMHYHGWHDWTYISSLLNQGIPSHNKDNLLTCPYGDFQELERVVEREKTELAAIVMEPVHLLSPPEGYLRAVRDLTQIMNIVLIFDEVVTGVRFGLGGAQAYLNVTPDISCFSKALSNGYPLSAIVGRADIMEKTKDAVTTQTCAEETLSLAAALETLKFIEANPVIDKVWNLGKMFKSKFNALSQQYGIPVNCLGYPPRLELAFEDFKGWDKKVIKGYFLEQTALDGFLFGHAIFISYAHQEAHIEKALQSCKKIFCSLKDLSGEAPLPCRGQELKELW